MTPRTRRISFGSAGALVVVGVIVGLLIGGKTGEVVGVTLGTLAAGAVVLLIFLEIGLSEDRDRAEEEARRRKSD